MAEPFRKHWMRSLGLGAVLVSAAAAAEERPCPPGRDEVDVRITPRVEHLPERSVYVYRYTVTVLPSSRLPVGRWMLEVDEGDVRSVEAPEGWAGYASAGRVLLWPRHAGREPPADQGGAGTGFALEPGSSVAGFVLESPLPPGPKTAYVTGELRVRPFRSELEAERAIARCKTLGKSMKEAAKRVRTAGPADDGVLPVPVRVRPEREGAAVLADGDAEIPVAILAGGGVEIAALDPATVVFGPSRARPVGGAERRDVDGDGRADLVLRFPAGDTGLSRGDTFAFVTGSTRDGRAIRGFAALRAAGPGARGSGDEPG